MKKLFLLLLLIPLLTGCGSRFKDFQDAAASYATSDKKISADEYAKLQKIIGDSDEEAFKKFKNDQGEIDHEKVRDYLLKFLQAKKIDVSAQDIEIPVKSSNFTLDVYIENSASMDGYVSGVTEFETAIYKMLADFKVKDFCQTLNLNYINRTVTYTRENAQSPDVQDFIEKLEPANFKQRGGDRGVSDIASVVRTVTDGVNNNHAAMLVSDFVFSPGKGKDADEYLNNQSVGIQIALSEKLRTTDLSVIVLQLESTFRGTYYDLNDRPIRLPQARRPYYVWFIGTNDQIKTILDSKILDSVKGGVKNRVVFTSGQHAKALEYKILLRPRVGDFELPNGTKGPISNPRMARDRDSKNSFEFYVAVDFSGEIQGKDFFSNKANYKVNDNAYALDVEAVDPNDRSLTGFTHKLKLTTSELKPETLKIEIIGSLPSWAEEFSSDDDSAILTDDSEKTKTFGLSHLIEGIRNAFFPQDNSTTNSLTITIDR